MCPILGPGSSFAISIIPLPSILSIPTDTGSRIASSTIDLYFRSLYGFSFGRPVPILSHTRTFIRSQTFSFPTFVMSRRTADSVIVSVSEKNICQRMSVVTFSIIFLENFKSFNIFFAIFAPTTSCP